MSKKKKKKKKKNSLYLSLPLLLGARDDLLVGVAHHGDQHVQQ